jgi:hypothetical protein
MSSIPHLSQPDRFFIAPLQPYQKPPDNSIMHGSWNCVMDRIMDSHQRREAEALVRRADEARKLIARADGIRASQLIELPNILSEAVTRLAKAEARMARIEEMNAALEAKILKYEQQAARQRVDDAIAELQGPDIHEPTGELHELAAKDAEISYPPLRQPQDEDEDEPGGELGGATDPVTDPAELAHPYVPKYRTPAAVSLGRADDIDWRFRP